MMRTAFRRAALVAFGIILPTALTAAASAKELLTMGAIADPAYEASVWAITNGKISNPDVDIKVDFMPIPASMQAAMTQQYNLIGNGILSIVQMAESGIPVKVFATEFRYNPDGHADDFWVMKDSPIKSLEDLKGKTVAVGSVEAQNIVSLRFIMSQKYHMNASAVGGDIKFVEMPASQFEAALQAGRVDAAVFANVAAYVASKSGKYRSVLQGSKELESMFGGPMPSVVLFGYAQDMQKRPAVYEAAATLLKQAADYALAHQDEVFSAVAPKYNMQKEDLQTWFTTYGQMPNALGPTDKPIFAKVWESGKALGILQKVPKVDDLVWDKAKVQ